jgi:gas vesicle protein
MLTYIIIGIIIGAGAALLFTQRRSSVIPTTETINQAGLKSCFTTHNPEWRENIEVKRRLAKELYDAKHPEKK